MKKIIAGLMVAGTLTLTACDTSEYETRDQPDAMSVYTGDDGSVRALDRATAYDAARIACGYLGDSIPITEGYPFIVELRGSRANTQVVGVYANDICPGRAPYEFDKWVAGEEN